MRLTNENTAVVMDSTADFPDAQERFPNLRVVPLYVSFGAETFRDYVELDPHTFYARLRSASATPTTSQPTPQDFLATYEELAGYERIYSLHISSRLSGTCGSASLAAQELGGDAVRLLDTESVSVGISMLALGIRRLLERGTSDAEIEALAASHRQRSGLLFTVDTLEFLARGGRIGRARALAGSLLHVKPILTIADGEVVPLTRVRGRGREKALQEFRRRFEAATTAADGLHVGIAHAEADDAVAQLRALVLDARPQTEIELVTSLGAVVGTHAGPGTIGFFWFQD
ncbi:MAG: DegV family protein [Gaiellaceae bacterium MAG52_C11]|nr:DegV family protein [Candidatus Gaiellasilicea maunaloa]